MLDPWESRMEDIAREVRDEERACEAVLVAQMLRAMSSLEAEIEQMRAALTELAEAIDDGLCNSSCPDFDADRLDRAMTKARRALLE